MRVLLTADPFLSVPPKHYGGIERVIASLIVKLRERGHTIGLVAHPESTVPVDYFLAWRELQPATFLAHGRNVARLLKAESDFQPSLIHSFSRLLYLTPLLLRKVPKLASYQRLVSKRPVQTAAFLGGRSIAFTGCSRFIAGMGSRYGGVWHAIPNFVDTEFYKFSSTVADDAPLVFLSRIEQIKGAHIAIEVAKKTGRRLLIAGNFGEHGRDRQYWDEVIKPDIGQNGVEYLGPVDDAAKVALLRSAAALIVPVQWDEPFGIVFVEALACGTPVISYPRGALPEIIRDGIDGFLTNNVNEACRVVQKIPSLDRGECRRRAETTFSANVVVRQYELLYEALTKDL